MSTHTITIDGKKIILVGTAHVSKESMALVEKTLNEEQPDVVGVELDALRLKQLLSGNKWENTNVLELIQDGQAGLILLNLFLSNMQKQIGAKVGVKPGAEMITGIDWAKENKKTLLLMDRSLQITMKRALSQVSLWEKLKLGGSLMVGLFGAGEQIDEKKIEELKQGDMVTHLMKELSREYPQLKKTLVDERDAYIAHSLLQMKGEKIVGIIGAGHVDGIMEHLRAHGKENADLPSLEELVSVPEKKKNVLLEYGIPIAFVGILIYLLLQNGLESSLHFIGFWVLGHGFLAGLGALIGGAHWKTVLGVVATAWLAALHPLVAAGWIAAAMETKRESPSVKDFTGLSELNQLRDFTKNRVTKILVITVLTNLGSMIATFAVIPYLIGIM